MSLSSLSGLRSIETESIWTVLGGSEHVRSGGLFARGYQISHNIAVRSSNLCNVSRLGAEPGQVITKGLERMGVGSGCYE